MTQLSDDDSDNPESSQLEQGIETLRAGNAEEAVAIFKGILKTTPREAAAWDNLAIALMQLNRWDEAEKAMRYYVKLIPDDAVGYLRLGVIMRRREAHDDALVAFQHAVKLEPLQVVAHKELGRTLLKLGRLKEARDAFKEAISLKATYADAWCGLGEVCEAEGKMGLAIRVYNDALQRIAPEKRGPVYGRMGLIYGKMNDWASSRTALEKAIAKGESDPRITYALGVAYSQLGELTAAEQQQVMLESIGSDLKRQLQKDINKSAEAHGRPKPYDSTTPPDDAG